jgi:hypothetical protein
MSGPLLSDGDLPPWDCTVIHFSSDWNHTDVLLRCSHMIGDGQLFMQLLKDVMFEYGEDGDETASVASDSDGGSVASSSAPSSRAGTSGGGSFTSGAGRAPGSPLLIRAVHQSSGAFLPPPSVERAARERELKRQKQEQARLRRQRDGLTGDVRSLAQFLWR